MKRVLKADGRPQENASINPMTKSVLFLCQEMSYRAASVSGTALRFAPSIIYF